MMQFDIFKNSLFFCLCWHDQLNSFHDPLMEWNTLFHSFSAQKPVWWFSMFHCLKIFFGIWLYFKIVWSVRHWGVLPLLPLRSFPPLDIFRHVLSSPWKSLPSLGLHLANSHSLSRLIMKITPIIKLNFPYNPSFFLFLIHRIFL